MTITRYGAKLQVIGAHYVDDKLCAVVKLLEQFEDGSGKVGEEMTLEASMLEADGSLPEIAAVCSSFVKLLEKEESMLNTLKEASGKTLVELAVEYNKMVPPSKRIKKFRHSTGRPVHEL